MFIITSAPVVPVRLSFGFIAVLMIVLVLQFIGEQVVTGGVLGGLGVLS
jgi:hypothetical protein